MSCHMNPWWHITMFLYLQVECEEQHDDGGSNGTGTAYLLEAPEGNSRH